jgi:hypothetical protein
MPAEILTSCASGTRFELCVLGVAEQERGERLTVGMPARHQSTVRGSADSRSASSVRSPGGRPRARIPAQAENDGGDVAAALDSVSSR